MRKSITAASDAEPCALVVNFDEYKAQRRDAESPRPSFTEPPSDPISHTYQPLLIDTDFLAQIGIVRGDLLVASLAQRPAQGQLAYVLASGENLIGYYFKTIRGVRLESVCAKCAGDDLRDDEIVEAAPITWLCILRGGTTLQVPFTRFKGEQREGGES
jgi:hypothetical protein